jgi:putative NADPH-quinone reductase
MAELMRPIEATAHLCGMTLAEPLVVHAARVLDDEALAAYAAGYRALLGGEPARASA